MHNAARTTSLAAALTLAVASPAAAQATPQGSAQPHHVAAERSELVWVDGPASLPAGARIAVLEGNPTQPGPFTLRLRFPDDYRIAPHSHPAVERVTVITGAFVLMREAESPERGKVLTAGGFAMMPPEMVHHVRTRGETEIQLNGIGPWSIRYVKAEDDPRNRRP